MADRGSTSAKLPTSTMSKLIANKPPLYILSFRGGSCLRHTNTATSRLLISLLVGYVSIYSYKLIGLCLGNKLNKSL